MPCQTVTVQEIELVATCMKSGMTLLEGCQLFQNLEEGPMRRITRYADMPKLSDIALSNFKPVQSVSAPFMTPAAGPSPNVLQAIRILLRQKGILWRYLSFDQTKRCWSMGNVRFEMEVRTANRIHGNPPPVNCGQGRSTGPRRIYAVHAIFKHMKHFSG